MTRTSFYDIRGRSDLGRNDPTYGSQRMPLHVREPYVQAERLIARRRTEGATRFLDLCCGTGVHSVYPATLGYAVTGVDLSPISIKAAEKLASMNGVRADFLVGDALEVLSGLEPFDVIFVSGSLFYFPLSSTLDLIASKLRERGCLICVETNGDNRTLNLYRRGRAAIRRDRDKETVGGGLLGFRDLALIRKKFPQTTVGYFDCTTLGGALLPARCQTAYHRAALRLDRSLLKSFRGLAFKFLIDAPSTHGNPASR